MKKEIIAFFIFVFLLISIVISVAQTDAPQLVKPGIKPGNLLYRLDLWIETLQLGLSGQGPPRARMYIYFAEERLSEAKALLDENKNDRLIELITIYEDYIANANLEIAKAKKFNLDTTTITKEMDIAIDKQVIALEYILEKSPDSAKPAIQKALDNAKNNSAQLKTQNKKE